MTASIVLPTGGERATQQRITDQADRKAANAKNFRDWEWLRLEAPADGEIYGGSGFYRFVTDEPDWPEAKLHSFIDPKPAPKNTPEDRAKSWPKKLSATCRHSRGFDALYDDCVICDDPSFKNEKGRNPYAGLRLLAVAVEREQVEGTQDHVNAGQIHPSLIGEQVLVDKTVTKSIWVDGKDTGETRTIPQFVVAEFGLDNFFDKLIGFKQVYGTVLDRDYKITRKGKGTETDYNFAPMDVQLAPDGKKYDLRRPEIAAAYENEINLTQLFADRASDDYYNKFFNPHVAWEWPTKDGDDNTSAATTEEEEVNQEALDKMRERLLAKK